MAQLVGWRNVGPSILLQIMHLESTLRTTCLPFTIQNRDLSSARVSLVPLWRTRLWQSSNIRAFSQWLVGRRMEYLALNGIVAFCNLPLHLGKPLPSVYSPNCFFKLSNRGDSTTACCISRNHRFLQPHIRLSWLVQLLPCHFAATYYAEILRQML